MMVLPYNRILTTMMKSSLVGSFFPLLLSSTVFGLGSVVSRDYSYIQDHYTWPDAQSYCRESHGDLATIYRQSDLDNKNLMGYHAWIGLHREQNGSSWNDGWIWSHGEKLDFCLWDHGEPDYGEKCAYVTYSRKKVSSEDCGKHFFFICEKSEFIPESKTWDEANEYCKTEYHCMIRLKDHNDLKKSINQEDFPVWIGLHRDEETWKWSTGLSNYTDWTSGEPGISGDCVSISSLDKKMATRDCFSRFPFICYKDNMVLVKENKTWEEALEHCRTLRSSSEPDSHYDLLSVQPEDYNHVMSKVMEADAEEVWIGLRFLAGEWLWVNGANMLYSDLPQCPPMLQHCGALSKNGNGTIEIRDCAEERSFLCYSVSAS